MSNENNSNLHLADILGLIFIILKLSHVISWSWLWVLSPFWVSWVIVLIIYIIVSIRNK